MKEATSDLSSGIVVAVCISILVAFFYFTIWPIIKTNFVAQTACEKSKCSAHPDDDGMVDCIYKDKDGTEQTIKCNYKG